MDAVFLYSSASAQMLMERRMSEISNNIANISTTGFKKQIPIFAGLKADFSKTHSLQGSQDATGHVSLQPIPVFPVVDEMITDFSQGEVYATGLPFNVAIEGPGLFQIQTPEMVRYTRNGTFALSPERKLVTEDGNPVLGVGGPITLPPGAVRIDETGRVSVQGPGEGPPVQVGIIQLVKITDRNYMQRVGNSLFTLMEGGEAVPVEEGTVVFRQGALEGSNVNPVTEMVDMISAMRHYEAAQKAIQAADDIDSKDVSQVGKLEG
jgi:flagellar basal-body rod protein FlgG